MRPFRTKAFGGFVAIVAGCLAACSFVLDADRLERGAASDGGSAADAAREGSVPAGDASAEGGPVVPAVSCIDEAPFTTVVEVALPALVDARYTSATLSQDERTAFVAVEQEASSRIVELARSAGAFADTGQALFNARDPSLSPPGLVLHYVQPKKVPSPDTTVWASHRTTATEPFESMDLVGTYAVADVRSPFFLASENLLYFAAAIDTESPAVLSVVREGATTVEGLEAASDPIPGEHLTLTADGATLYFATRSGIYRAKRVATPNQFGNVAQVEGLGLAGQDDTAPWISYDRCRLYFFRESTFMMAERKP